MSVRESPGLYDPNSIDYGENPMTDPGHKHTSASAPGGGGVNSTVLSEWNVNCGGIGQNPSGIGVVDLSETDNSTGNVIGSGSFPVQTYAEGATILQAGSAINCQNMDTTLGESDLVLVITVTSMDQANNIELLYEGVIAQSGPGQSGQTVAPASVNSQTGDDLVYDADTDELTTTAGGSYGITVSWAVTAPGEE